MTSRRNFIKKSVLASAATVVGLSAKATTVKNKKTGAVIKKPIVVSTWTHGLAANEGAWKVLSKNGTALDAVEKGVNVTEADFTNLSVGLGGLPDRDGNVTLDACIMDHNSNCGSVAFLQRIKHPVSVARMVMEKTPHIMLAGNGAQKFALDNGFKLEPKKLSPEAEKKYKEWLKTSQYKPVVNIENHDTIGMIALDAFGNCSGSCTTSGLAYKMHGRVGDSPIIGASLFVDNEIGCATATGVGEEVIRMCGAHTIVELMRNGASPMDACRAAVERIVKKSSKKLIEMQVGFLALNKNGDVGAFALQKGFNYAVYDETGNKLIDADYYFK